jgi:hypothetical protein
VSANKLTKLIELCEKITLADSVARRETERKLVGTAGSLAQFAAELAATNCAARETVLVIANPSAFIKAAADSNSIEIFPKPPTASDLVAIAAGEELSKLEFLLARKLTGKDFIQLKGFTGTDDKAWQLELATLRDLDQQIGPISVVDFLTSFEAEPIVELAVQIATSLSRKTPVIIDGARALLAASVVFEFAIAARSWIFVVDSPRSAAGGQLFKHRNWISLTANQVSAGDGLSAIAAISLARTAALLLRH